MSSKDSEFSQLAEFQRQFIDHLYWRRPITRYSVQSEQGLDLYSGSLYGGLNKALQEIYPMSCRFLGDAFFTAMADRFIERFPSRVERLDDYGVELADFVTQFEPTREISYLPTLLKLEWHWHQVFHSKTSRGFDFARFAELAETKPEQIEFEVADQLTVLEADYPVDLLWNHLYTESSDTLDLNTGPVSVVLWRCRDQVCISQLSDLQKAFLEQLQLRTNFSELCDQLDERTMGVFSSAVELGWITSFKEVDSND